MILLNYIINLLKVFIFYLILFALCRLVFLLYFVREILPQGVAIFPLSLVKALPLDVSTACYLSFIPLLLLFISYFAGRRLLHRILKIYLLLISLICIILAISEIGFYQELHVKLYYDVLRHLQHPGEVVHSITISLMMTVVAIVVLISYVTFKILQWIFPHPRVDDRIQSGERAPLPVNIGLFLIFLLTGTLLVIGCRGGLQPIPINEGEVYFSDNQCVNDATVNPLWNITHSFIENRLVLKGATYKVMSDSQAESIVHQLYSTEKDTTVYIFKTSKPNICFLILESWTADVIASLGGYENLTPNFEKLIREGYFFTNIKPTGHVSDQGIPGILSGYPALPIGSAINQPERQVHLSCIHNELGKAGYYSSFFFGGQLIYGNIKAYIYRNKFDRVVEQQDLPSSIPAGRLGIHDSVMLNIWLDSINRMKPPFLTCLFTLSTHPPYDEPAPQTVDWGGRESPFLNSVIYTDRQIGKFFEEAVKQPWYDNTIFILVADHSHSVPKNYDYDSPEFYRIPLLICGGALKDEMRGIKNNKLGSQTDIAFTLLHQLGFKSDDYRWSKNLLNPYSKQFAFYTFSEGFGYADTSGTVLWNKTFPTHSRNTGKNQMEKEELSKTGAAMLQVLMNDFLSK